MPWAIPPCCWPSTSSGLRMRPQSSTATWRSWWTRPVSRSTSTTAMWAPNGKLDWPCLKSSSSRSAAAVPSGLPEPSSAAAAAWAQVTTGPATPLTPNPAADSSTSCTDASSRWAAISRARTTSSVLELWIALPPVCSDRDPMVPAPRGTSAVSDCTSRIVSIGTWSTAEATWANAVSWPWPWLLVPAETVNVPSGWACALPHSTSRPSGAVTST